MELPQRLGQVPQSMLAVDRYCREALLSGKTLRLGPYTVSTPTDSPVLAEKDF
jgi:hypothetical protein